METNSEKSVWDTLLGVFRGESKPEVIVTTNVEVENKTFNKIVLLGIGLVVGGILFAAVLFRSTMRRYFKPIS